MKSILLTGAYGQLGLSFRKLFDSKYEIYFSGKNYNPKSGIYLEYFVDEPNWIYLWVVKEDKIPRSYQLTYSKKLHKSLEGVEQQAQEGNFMVLQEEDEGQAGEEGDEEKGEGYTIGGDMSFYKWDYKNALPSKN